MCRFESRKNKAQNFNMRGYIKERVPITKQALMKRLSTKKECMFGYEHEIILRN